MKNTLRISSNRTEIIKILQNIKNKSKQSVIWQNLENSRIVNHGKIVDINIHKNTVKVVPDQKNTPFKFNKAFTIYFRGDEQSILFKQELDLSTDNSLVINIPEEVRIIEKRINIRYILDSTENNVLHLFKRIKGTDALKEFVVQTLDISSNGLSFVIPSQYFQYFNVHDIFLIHELLQYRFYIKIKGEVVHIADIKYRDNNTFSRGYKVGVKLFNGFPGKFLQKIERICI